MAASWWLERIMAITTKVAIGRSLSINISLFLASGNAPLRITGCANSGAGEPLTKSGAKAGEPNDPAP